ncbi:MAG: hypothetical protein PGN25_05900 [Methylorubrum populi]
MPDWNDIETAPKDRKVDLWGKIWLADGDRFVGERYPDCWWDSGDSMGNRKPEWSGLPKGWRATHWMERPDAPDDAPVRQ